MTIPKLTLAPNVTAGSIAIMITLLGAIWGFSGRLQKIEDTGLVLQAEQIHAREDTKRIAIDTRAALEAAEKRRDAEMQRLQSEFDWLRGQLSPARRGSLVLPDIDPHG